MLEGGGKAEEMENQMSDVKHSRQRWAIGGLEKSMFDLLPPVKMPLYPFALSLLVFDPKYSPRHPMFELWVDRGMDLIEAVLNHQPLPHGEGLSLTFLFPERWMCPQEQRKFLLQISIHPDVSRVSAVRILTQCPLIICNAMAEQIGIYQLKETD